MSTNHVLFIHGTNVRDKEYATDLINMIQQTTPIEPLVVYWGDMSEQEERKLRDGYVASNIWKKVWFQDTREHLMIRFVGDAALYLSRYIGAQVVKRVAKQVVPLKDCPTGDRLHLVTHSLGTVILFDLLFSSRWDDNNDVTAIRDVIYGVGPHPEKGIRLGSITTMGSPIGIFSLMDVASPAVDANSNPHNAISTHDITPSLVQLLQHLSQVLDGRPVPWRNFVHPGDPIASPLEAIIPNMVEVNEKKKSIDIRDRLVPLAKVGRDPLSAVLSDLLGGIFSKTAIPILNTGNAHNSYWLSPFVAREIAQLMG